MRNLDVTTLRSFVAVAEAGGVTRAAGFLNLTQSAVSMQIKRLEVVLDTQLLDRSGRGVALTGAGEQLLSYARRLVSLNDEAVNVLKADAPSGSLRLGVPHDVVYPVIPRALKQFAAEFPNVKVTLESSHTKVLHQMFARGECDVILTTEAEVSPGGQTLVSRPLHWVGAPSGVAWRRRPLNIAFGRLCTFRPAAIQALDTAGVRWELMTETDNDSTIHATVGADLAVHAMIEGTEPPQLARINHFGDLPELPVQNINLYKKDSGSAGLETKMATILNEQFSLR